MTFYDADECRVHANRNTYEPKLFLNVELTGDMKCQNEVIFGDSYILILIK